MNRIAFLIVSQSLTLARGVCEVVTHMAPEVPLCPCQCPCDTLAESVEHLRRSLEDFLHKESGEYVPGHEDNVIIMADCGSARLAVQQLIHQTDAKQHVKLFLGHGPFLEGTLAGAIAAQQGEDIDALQRAISGASHFFSPFTHETKEDKNEKEPYQLAPREVCVGFHDGLSARPAAIVARMASGFHADIQINHRDATSVLTLMGLGISYGDTVVVSAQGPEAALAIKQLSFLIEHARSLSSSSE